MTACRSCRRSAYVDRLGCSIDLYCALRCFNPTPYMYFFNFGVTLMWSAVRRKCWCALKTTDLPDIAGTCLRARPKSRSGVLEEDLLSDEQEIAEHLMLIDLGRKSIIGRVSKSVRSEKLTEKMAAERYSNVMHIVSNVAGQLKEGLTAMDALRAILPAGTLSGVPKIRAMEIIDELETTGQARCLRWRGRLLRLERHMDTAGLPSAPQ